MREMLFHGDKIKNVPESEGFWWMWGSALLLKPNRLPKERQ